MDIGYIYIRTNEYWDLYDAYKLGKTLNIPDRETSYITSEIKRGKYIIVIELDASILDDIEKKLQLYFTELNLYIKFNAGTEFFNKKIINYIIPYFDENNILYKILSDNDIDNLIRKIRIHDDISHDDIYNNTYHPRDYQMEIINKSSDYFQNNKKGLLIIPCGVGKTLISLWITYKLNSNTILIGVPNKLLLKQWYNIIYILFKNIPCLIVSDGISMDNITCFLENNKKKCIVITTYSSSHKIYYATQYIDFSFDMKINDEAHHLTSNNIIIENNEKKFIQMLNISSNKQISLTATIKQLENIDNNNIISNDNIEYFGDIIDKRCLLWAINKNIVCDYVIQTIIMNEEELNQNFEKNYFTEDNEKRLFLSAFSSLKSIFDGNSHHLLVYSNNKNNSLKIVKYIKTLLDDNFFDIEDLYYSSYHSDMSSKEQVNIINKFEKSKYGIITCVYCLGEGYDNNNIDGVVFSENMSSNIRIVQSSLRASRKNINQPNKIAKIILPILHKDDWLEDNNNQDLRKIKEVIYQMGLEDETINQKIKVFTIEIKKYISSKNKNIQYTDNFGEYDDDLTSKLKLKTIKRSILGISYEKAKTIIASKNIKNKEEYFELCNNDNRLSFEPELIYNGLFTNWIEYLSIQRIYYDLETCKNRVNELLLLFPEIKNNYLDLSTISNYMCTKDPLFPPHGLWVEYYNLKNLSEVIVITNNKKKNGVVL